MSDNLCTCESCKNAIENSLTLIGRKWSILILWHLYSGTKRFNELQRLLTGISPKTLATRLQELEAQKIISRQIYPEVPPKVEYSLTEKGRQLRPIFSTLIAWTKQ